MKSIGLFFVSTVLAATAPAATVNWSATLTSAPFTGTSTTITFSGNSTMSPLGSGTMSAPVSLSSIGGSTVVIPYTLTFSSGGSLKGNLSIPATALEGGPLTGSGTVNSGTGTYAGYTGNFPSLTGTTSGSVSTGLTISFSGTGTVGAGGTPPPTISAVLDAGSYTPGVAQGGMFVVKGTGLSNTGYFTEGFPLPTTSSNSGAGGVSISFAPAFGGAATKAYLIYEYSASGVNQLAAVLPSTVAPGSYNVTVTSNGITSSTFGTSVSANKAELFTADSTGNGLVLGANFQSSTQYEYNRFTTGTVNNIPIAPAHPGDAIVIYATGLGPITTPDNQPAPGGNTFGASVQVMVGGLTIAPGYAGRSPNYAAFDQINFTLPANTPTGCAVLLQITENGVPSQSSFISIAAPGASACTYPGFTSSQLQNFDNGTVVYSGEFSVGEQSETSSFGNHSSFIAAGGFTEYTGFELPGIPAAITTNPQQGCTFVPFQQSQGQTAIGVGISLDAGTITLNGPSNSGASNQVLSDTDNIYTGTITAIPAGTWSLAGSGGANVGAFNASLTTGAPVSVTLPTSVNRSAGFTISWTGGNSSDSAVLIGSTTMLSNGVATAGGGFICITTIGAGSLTVPSSITSQLLAVTAAQETAGTAEGGLSFVTGTSTTFNAPLVGGGSISNATFGSSISFESAATFQ